MTSIGVKFFYSEPDVVELEHWKMMRYGNSTHHLKNGVTLGLIIGAAAFVFCALMFHFYETLPPKRLIPLTFIILLPAVTTGLVIAPTLMFSVYILGDWVEHRFLDRWTISRAHTKDFVEMVSPSGFFSAKVVFSDGTKMRLWGVHMAILSSLEAELERRKSEAKQS